MENQVIEHHDAIQNEEFPDEFQCCVCLDLLYKPVVLACGHMACFWCVYRAMDFSRESHCPVCRHPYGHFPRICQLLHFLLLKLFPLAHERREKEVSGKEKESGYASPQLDKSTSDSSPNKVFSTSIEPKSDSSQGAPSLDSSHTIILEDCKITSNASSSYQTNVSAEKDGLLDDESLSGASSCAVIFDLTCAICKQLLCRPIVLNCGDVFCEACIIYSSDNECKCPVCQSPHPTGFPNVCLILEHFLQERFPLEYARSKESSRKQTAGRVRASIGSMGDRKRKSRRTAPTNIHSSWLLGRSPKVHPGCGCDYCGMCPIIGKRYKCKDCKEKIGFDLCEGCYNSPCKLPGRFNQQHTEDHQFDVVESHPFNRIVLSHETATTDSTDERESNSMQEESNSSEDGVPLSGFLMDDSSEDESTEHTA